MKKYLSECRYRKMNTVKFAENVLGIKLYWYQKIFLNIMDINLNLQKQFFPSLYYSKYLRG